MRIRGYLRPEKPKVIQVPGVDGVRVDFEGALGQQRVVNGFSHDSLRHRRGDGRAVVLFVKSNDCQTFPDLVEEEQCLISAHSLSSRHAGKTGVNLSQGMGGTAGVLLICFQKGRGAGPVVLMLKQNGCNQD